MNDADFDRLLTDALEWRAGREIDRQTPRRLAMRQLAVRLENPGVQVRSRLLGGASSGGVRGWSGRRLIGQFAGTAAVLLVAVLLFSYVLGPGVQFGATGPPHESQRLGYRLTLPDSSWSVTEVPGEWQTGTFLDAMGPGTDYYERGASALPQPLVYMWIGSQPIPEGMTFDGWLYLQDGVTAASASCFELQGEYANVNVDGEAARVGTYYCPDFDSSGIGWATVQVLFEHEGRGYAMYFWPDQPPQMAPLDDVRRAALEWLRSLDLL